MMTLTKAYLRSFKKECNAIIKSLRKPRYKASPKFLQLEAKKPKKQRCQFEVVYDVSVINNIQVVRVIECYGNGCDEVQRYFFNDKTMLFQSYGCYMFWHYRVNKSTKLDYRDCLKIYYHPDRINIKSVLPVFEKWLKEDIISRINNYYYFEYLTQFTQNAESLLSINRELFIQVYKNEYSNTNFNNTLDKFIRTFQLITKWGYKVENIANYVDHLNSLARLGLDLKSPKWVAPKDFWENHNQVNRLMERYWEKERLNREKEKLEKNKEYNTEFMERLNKYGLVGLCIVSNGIKIIPLLSVEDVYAEGKQQHHCVYANGYYKKADTLLFTSFDENDNKLETIEYNLDQMKVVQSRGACNKHLAQHDDIVNLANTEITKHLMQNRLLDNQASMC